MEDFEIKDGVLVKYHGNEENVVIPENVMEIGESAFYLNSDIKSVVIPKNVKTIGVSAFCSCYNLETIELSNGLIKIEGNAFGDCNSLKSVYIPSSVKEMIEPFVLCGCLEEIIVDDNSEYFKSIDGVLYNKDCTELIKYPEGKQGDSFEIPFGVKKLDYWSIGDNFNLKKITIPETVEEIDGYAFFDCRNVEELSIPNGVKVIKEVAFAICRKMKSITLPKSLNKIERSVFSQCDSLKDVYYQGTKEEWKKIRIDSDDNDSLKNANIIYNSK